MVVSCNQALNKMKEGATTGSGSRDAPGQSSAVIGGSSAPAAGWNNHTGAPSTSGGSPVNGAI